MKPCKHENADHLMPGDRFEPWVSDDVACLRSFAECEQFRCLDCEAWLPLGPAASVDPDELYLAELLADTAMLYEPSDERTRFEDDLVSIMAMNGLAP